MFPGKRIQREISGASAEYIGTGGRARARWARQLPATDGTESSYCCPRSRWGQGLGYSQETSHGFGKAISFSNLAIKLQRKERPEQVKHLLCQLVLHDKQGLIATSVEYLRKKQRTYMQGFSSRFSAS